MTAARVDAKTLVVVGAQWGDEGKGKIVDLLAERSDVIVRFQGGNNAGHTLVVGGEKTVLHLVPSGVLHRGKVCVIANGVVVDPLVLLEEVDALRARGFLPHDEDLRVGEQAHLILPYHKAIDLARERLRGQGKIGTTGRGIGPAYEDKMARIGIRIVDLLEEETFRRKLRANLEEKNAYLRAMLGEQALGFDEIFESYRAIGERLRPHVTDTARFLDREIRRGRRVLFEGAQGTMLDVDHGTYPFVTSSNCVAGAALAGSGIAPSLVARTLGITKAYTTRVGSGPFPTEMEGELGEKLRRDGDEYGATTGRARRCGWFDAVVVRHAARLSGLDGLAITKLDVLAGIDPLRICVAYRSAGETIDHVPASVARLGAVEPVYEDLAGFGELSRGERLNDLPVNARRYLERIVELTGVPVQIVSVGARREQTLVIDDPLG
ncbi:MAG: adenylosuccinate synthase [Deltaproteobacteria bacterium]|nr:adenylosuccinate synthase [Deltaproteobacteria bacterium]